MLSKVKKNIKKKLEHWPLVLWFVTAINHYFTEIWHRLWQWQRLIPYSWRSYPDKPFCGNRMLCDLVSSLIKSFHLTALIETGTCKAVTTLFLDSLAKGIPVYTCEVYGPNYQESRWRLRNTNVILEKLSSPDFIKKLIDKKILGGGGGIPFFFLDAHRGGNMPLLREMETILSLSQAVIIIDDFLVPGKDDFHYDVCDCNGEIRPLDFSFIQPTLNNHNYHYQFFYPNYEKRVAVTPDRINWFLSGHIVIFVNLKKQFENWEYRNKFVSFYKEFEYNPIDQ